MKNLFLLTLLALAFAASAQQKRTIGPYSRLNVSGSFEIILTEGPGEATITAKDPKTIDRIKTEIHGDALEISMSGGMWNYGKITIELPYENLQEIKLIGSGSIASNGTVKSSQLEVQLNGSGNIILDVVSDKLAGTVTGSGTVKLNGKSPDFKASVTGSGSLKATSLIAANVSAEVAGSGNAAVFAGSDLMARVIGSGNIKYNGNPKTEDTKVSGSGSIEKI